MDRFEKAAPRERTRRRSMKKRRRTVPGAIAGGVILVASVSILFFLKQGMLLETAIAQWGIENVLGIPAAIEAEGTLFTVGVGTATIFSIQLVIACSVAMLVVPLGLVAALMLLTGRASVLRAVPAFIVGALGLLAVNATRLLLIAGMTHSQRLPGFGWSHSIYGSLVALAGLALVLLGFVWFVTGPRPKKTKPTVAPLAA